MAEKTKHLPQKPRLLF